MGRSPFRIPLDGDAIDDLHDRLRRTRWPASFGDDWSDGAELGTVRSMTQRWVSDFSWPERVEHLERHRHELVDIDGVSVHVWHAAGVGPRPLPLILSHGWPSTFAEWDRVIGPLCDPAAHGADPADAFHVVAPSLPGYGYSSVPTGPGMSPRVIAGLFVEVMQRLGYERFAAHGCDWGSYITALMGLDAPDRLVGIHMGMVSMSAPRPPDGDPVPDRSDEDRAFIERASNWRGVEQGYISIQSTKPQSLAYGLTDSPAGLAAWIIEKWRAWSDCEGDLERAIAIDDLLTALTIYWNTATINSANRLYFEHRRDPVRLGVGQRVEVPAGFLLEAPGDGRERGSFTSVPRVGAPPRHRAERVFDVARWTVADRGGHFPALETPELFVEEVRAFFRPLR